MKLKGKNILVTGGAGFIPSHIADLLVKKNANVTVMDNLKDGFIENVDKKNISFFKADVRDEKEVKKIIKKQDVVFHLAANANVPYSVEHPDYDFHTNAVGSFNVLKACVDYNIEKVVYASTAAVYGEPDYTPIDEKHPLNPISPYGASKLTGERLGFAYHKTYNLPFTAIRIFNTYGPRQPRYVMFDLLKKLCKNPNELEVLGTGNQIRDYCYVTDTAKAFVLAAEKDESVGEAFNIAGGNPISIKELVSKITDALDLCDTKVTYTGKSWKGDITKLMADISKIKEVLGFEPETQLDDGIPELKKWYLKKYKR